MPNSKGNPVSGGAITRLWEKFAIFDWSHRLSGKRCKIGSWLLWNVNIEVIVGRSIRVSSDDLEWPYIRTSRSQHFSKSSISKNGAFYVHSYFRTIIGHNTRRLVTLCFLGAVYKYTYLLTYFISNGTMFGDLDWPLNASRGFVSISCASCRIGDALFTSP